LVCASAVAQPRASGTPPRFDGKAVTITEPETDLDGLYPKGPASVCLEAQQRQCYTAPEGFGRFPDVKVVQLKKDLPALLFSAASGGVSGFRIHFALLRPGDGKDLQNLFIPDVTVSSQSQSDFWNDPTSSDAQFFVTADNVWGRDESHFSPHRYIVSAYTRQRSQELDDFYYYLEDRYMTARSYDGEAGADVLAAERPEIIARLRRLKLRSRSRPLPR
jgi:hypothetical protein